MIHLIYIYFVISAFIAGTSLDEKDILNTIGLFLFAPIILLVIGILYVFDNLLNRLLILDWYRLYFTDYYKKANNPTFIKIRTQQYQGIRDNNKQNYGWYRKFFMRQLDKKYNYGITTNKNNI